MYVVLSFFLAVNSLTWLPAVESYRSAASLTINAALILVLPTGERKFDVRGIYIPWKDLHEHKLFSNQSSRRNELLYVSRETGVVDLLRTTFIFICASPIKMQHE